MRNTNVEIKDTYKVQTMYILNKGREWNVHIELHHV